MHEQKEMRLAVLVDADNTSKDYLGAIIDEVVKYGIPTIKHAYGDWEKLKGWKDILLDTGTVPIQQYAYTVGKNATDAAMIIEAMDILHAGNIDGFVLVSSDSDFTPLALRLRESGKKVFGIGKNKTPKPFVRACDKFIYVEILDGIQIDKPIDDTSAKPDAATNQAAKTSATGNTNTMVAKTTAKPQAQAVDKPETTTIQAAKTSATDTTNTTVAKTTAKPPAQAVDKPETTTIQAAKTLATDATNTTVAKTTAKPQAQAVDKPETTTSQAAKTSATDATNTTVTKTTVKPKAQATAKPDTTTGQAVKPSATVTSSATAPTTKSSTATKAIAKTQTSQTVLAPKTTANITAVNSQATKNLSVETINFIAQCIQEAAEDNGFCALTTLGSLLNKKRPDFDSRNYGHTKLSKLLKSIDRFEVSSSASHCSVKDKYAK